MSKSEFLRELSEDVKECAANGGLPYNWRPVVPEHMVQTIADAEGIAQLAAIEEAWEFYKALTAGEENSE